MALFSQTAAAGREARLLLDQSSVRQFVSLSGDNKGVDVIVREHVRSL